MRFSIQREVLLKPLQLVSGSIERKHLQPILSNVLLGVKSQLLSLTGTDLEVELIARVALNFPADNGEFTLPARKLMDICRAFPEQSKIDFEVEHGKVVIRCGKTRFTLATMPVEDFPRVQEGPGDVEFSLKQQDVKSLIENTSFAMAHQDVRIYMNGLLLIFSDKSIRAVAADGHRLITFSSNVKTTLNEPLSVIVPRKAILELQRLFSDGNEEVGVVVGANHLRAIAPHFSFTTKLIDAKFPDYRRLIPVNAPQYLIVDKDALKQALGRVSVLFTEKVRGARIQISSQGMNIVATNADKDEAEEEVPITYQGQPIEIGLNGQYLLEYLSIVKDPTIKMSFTDPDGGVLFEPYQQQEEAAGNNSENRYVVMPMRL